MLPHEIPLWVDPQLEICFVTVNCQPREINHLARPDVAGPLLDSVRFRNEQFIWFAHLFLLMPDHVHALIAFPPANLMVGTPGSGVREEGGHLGEMSLPTNPVGTPGREISGGKAAGTAPAGGADTSATCPYPVGMSRRGVPARVQRAERTLQEVVSSWKRWTARQLGIQWQRDFFEHRLRHEESRREKADYILQNPVRKELAPRPEDWPFVYFADGQRPQFEW